MRAGHPGIRPAMMAELSTAPMVFRFRVPLHVIDEAVSRIRDGSIMDYEYSAAQARLVKVSAK